MVKKLIALTFAAALWQSSVAFAHSDHTHGSPRPISEQAAVTVATEVIDQFVDEDPALGFGKLDASWKEVPATQKRISTKAKDYYIVSVEHAEQGKTLFVLMSNTGEVYDANFTGEFSGLR